MTAPTKPTLPKWPFLVGDILLLVVAGYICWQGNPPLSLGELALLTMAVALAAVLGAAPFLLEHRGDGKLAELLQIERAVLQLRNIEALTRQINSATAGWQVIQDEASKAIVTAQQTSELMTREAQGFQEFLQKANNDERTRLRLEVDKQRRAEHDWLLVLTGVLDHVYALRQAAARSGQAGLVGQLDRFQDACHELTRRVGLVTYASESGEAFSEEIHQLAEPDQEIPETARVETVLACGYRFQGQLIRKALVTLLLDQAASSLSTATDAEAAIETTGSPSAFDPQANAAAPDPSFAEESELETPHAQDQEEKETISPDSPFTAVEADALSEAIDEEGQDADESETESVSELEATVESVDDLEKVPPFGAAQGVDDPPMPIEPGEPEVVLGSTVDSPVDPPLAAGDEPEEEDEIRPFAASSPAASEFGSEVDAVFGPDPFGLEPESREVDGPEETPVEPRLDQEELTQATWPDEEDLAEDEIPDDENEEQKRDDSKQGRLGFE